MINKIFNNLNNWRKFPDYQLERRIDIFFSIYLKDLLEKKTGEIILDEIIPEFPISNKLIKENNKQNTSCKIDYVLFSNDLKIIYFIELKTNNNSRNARQDFNLKKAKEIGFNKIIEGLKDIFISTKSREKYYYLIEKLKTLGLIDIPIELKIAIDSNAKTQVSLIKKIKPLINAPKIEIVYIQPESDKNDDIDFNFIFEYLKAFKDEISINFNKLLKIIVNESND